MIQDGDITGSLEDAVKGTGEGAGEGALQAQQLPSDFRDVYIYYFDGLWDHSYARDIMRQSKEAYVLIITGAKDGLDKYEHYELFVATNALALLKYQREKIFCYNADTAEGSILTVGDINSEPVEIFLEGRIPMGNYIRQNLSKIKDQLSNSKEQKYVPMKIA